MPCVPNWAIHQKLGRDAQHHIWCTSNNFFQAGPYASAIVLMYHFCCFMHHLMKLLIVHKCICTIWCIMILQHYQNICNMMLSIICFSFNNKCFLIQQYLLLSTKHVLCFCKQIILCTISSSLLCEFLQQRTQNVEITKNKVLYSAVNLKFTNCLVCIHPLPARHNSLPLNQCLVVYVLLTILIAVTPTISGSTPQ